jgi:hypothetical protein
MAVSGWIKAGSALTTSGLTTFDLFSALNKSKLVAKGVQKWPNLFLMASWCPNQPWWSKLAGFGWLKAGYV